MIYPCLPTSPPCEYFRIIRIPLFSAKAKVFKKRKFIIWGDIILRLKLPDINSFTSKTFISTYFFCARYSFYANSKKLKKGDLKPQKGGSNTFFGVDMNLMWKSTSKHISPAILVHLSQREQSKPSFVNKADGGTDIRKYGQTYDRHTDRQTEARYIYNR